MKNGRKTLGDRANERVRKILESHTPKPLSDTVKAKIEALIANAE
jgi:trimethylamine:corrinoid methyltransferase-like protein